MNFDTLIRQLADGRPISEIASATIQFVKNDTLRFAAAKKLQRLVEYRATLLGGGFHFLKPDGDRELIAFGITHNGVALFLERHSFRSLFYRGNTDVTDIT